MNGLILIYLVIVCFLEDAYIEDALGAVPKLRRASSSRTQWCDEKSLGRGFSILPLWF